MSEFDRVQWSSRFKFLLVAALLGLSYQVLYPLFGAILWAIILAILFGPIHQRLLVYLPNHPNTVSLLIVWFSGTLILAPILWAFYEIPSEAALIYRKLPADLVFDGSTLSDYVADIPMIGVWLHKLLAAIPVGTKSILVELKSFLPLLGQTFGVLLRGIANQLFQWVLTAICFFFFLKHATVILGSIRSLIGFNVDRYFHIIRSTVHAVSFGLFGGALAQGAIATIGYAVVGAETPLLLGVISAIASLIPVLGASLVWGPIAIGMILEDHLLSALGLTLWGIFIIHPTDNVIRPWVISHILHLPMLLVLLGVVGGVFAFGVVGAFVGPIVLGLGMSVCLERIASRQSDSSRG